MPSAAGNASGSSVEIILGGNDFGIAENAAEFGAVHLPEIETNEFGTPLLHSAFQQDKTLRGMTSSVTRTPISSSVVI